jgi:hypothetical protein
MQGSWPQATGHARTVGSIPIPVLLMFWTRDLAAPAISALDAGLLPHTEPPNRSCSAAWNHGKRA